MIEYLTPVVSYSLITVLKKFVIMYTAYDPSCLEVTQRKMNGNKFKPKNPIFYVLAQS